MNKFVLLVIAIGVLLVFIGHSKGTQDTESDQLLETKRNIYYRRCRAPVVYDLCRRECKCKDGRLYDCHRVRREFSTMSLRDRKAYVHAVKLISTHPWFKKDYEKLLTIHRTYFNRQIHEFEYFLPWHRWFILKYENLLRQVSCRITVPYWDFTLTAGQPFTGAIWDNTAAGLGGDGEGLPRICVKNGPFREGKWSLIKSAGGGCLKRNFLKDETFPDLIALQQFLSMFSSADKLKDFELMLRNDFHNNIHFFIGGFGGTMSTLDSAAAPEFFLLHSMVDKIWADWQKKSARHLYPMEFLYQSSKMPGTAYYSRDFLNLSQQPRCTAVKYAGPDKKMKPLLATIQRISVLPNVINRIPRRNWAQLRKEVINIFKIKVGEQERLKVLHHLFRPRVALISNTLQGADRKLGFSVKKIKEMAASGK